MTIEPPVFPLGNSRPIKIEEEMRTSYLDYAMSVIVSRALPDIREFGRGLHPTVYRGHAYEKGMMILSMAEDVLGTEVMDRLLREFFAANRGKTVCWADLKAALGEFGPIWIPEEMRTVGRHRFGIPLNVTEISSWGSREVAVMLQALGPLRVKSYYALDTGFLVAVEKEFGGGPNLIIELTSTNAVE